MNPQDHQYRFPGAVPFAETQSHIFFGRNNDIERLYKLVYRNPLVVLYGKSGLGKSSIINAGLIPTIKKDKTHTAIVIRFKAWTENSDDSPLSTTKAFLQSNNEKTFLSKWIEDDESLWLLTKNRQLNDGVRPLLIFDQFEELFGYPESEINAFMVELAELLHTDIPLRFIRRLEYLDDFDLVTEEEEDKLDKKLDARILFAIRSDKLHLIDRLKPYLPNVLRNMHELKALSIEDAKAAITKPAQMEGDFVSPKFEFTESALQNILSFLVEKDTQRVEGIMIQMLCEHYEREQVLKQGLTTLDLRQIGDPNDVVANYYQEKINAIDSKDQMAARKLIEDGLVSEGNGMRLSLHEAYILQKFGLDSAFLRNLIDKRLLRSEPFSRGGYTYELSHDRLILPVVEARKKRRAEEKERKRIEDAQLLEKEHQEELNRLREKAKIEEQKKIISRRRYRNSIVISALSIALLIGTAFYAKNTQNQKEKADLLNESLKDKNKSLDSTNIELIKQKKIAEEALEQANKLVASSYYYEDRIALAYGGKNNKNFYYFIDKKGNKVPELKEWDKAEQFSYVGLANVRKGKKSYKLDIDGRTFYCPNKFSEFKSDTINEFESVEFIISNTNDIDTIFKKPGLKAMLLIGEIGNYKMEEGQDEIVSKEMEYLQLRNFNLSRFPTSILEMENLRFLDIRYNNIAVLPDEIGNLKNIESIYFLYNQLDSIPSQIGNLTELRKLYFDENKLSNLPSSIGQLKNLNYLSLSTNQIKTLPIEFRELTNLETLFLDSNSVEDFPTAITGMENLQKLVLNKNDITTIPNDIDKLIKLRILELENNNVSELPESIKKLQNLELVKLSGNPIDSLKISELEEALPQCEFVY